MIVFAEIGFDNIQRANGIGIAITGMLIVFTALVLISTFIALLPRVLNKLAALLPEEHEPVHTSTPPPIAADDAAVVAAIGYVLHLERQKRVQQN